MSEPNESQDPPGSNDFELTRMQQVGIFVFVALCGFPALEMNGFGLGLPITLPLALALATAGGAVGGALMCSRPLVAGLVGGLLAGPASLLAVQAWTEARLEVWNLELVLVQGVACLPGLGVGWVLARVLK